jgi:imidazole glycerol phosphate synthase subunit hisF (EC 4.1.3.-)
MVAIDAKRRPGREEGRIMVDTPKGECWFECSFYGGREFTGIDAIAWAQKVEELGAGEIMLTSMDRDGTYDGFDIPLTDAVSRKIRIPVIASGGCGDVDHMLEVFQKTRASAALAASIFHYDEQNIGSVKRRLAHEGIEMRL